MNVERGRMQLAMSASPVELSGGGTQRLECKDYTVSLPLLCFQSVQFVKHYFTR